MSFSISAESVLVVEKLHFIEMDNSRAVIHGNSGQPHATPIGGKHWLVS